MYHKGVRKGKGLSADAEGYGGSSEYSLVTAGAKLALLGFFSPSISLTFFPPTLVVLC